MGWRPWQDKWGLTSLGVEGTKWWPGPTQAVLAAVNVTLVHSIFTSCSLAEGSSHCVTASSQHSHSWWPWGLTSTSFCWDKDALRVLKKVHSSPAGWYCNLSLENQIFPRCDLLAVHCMQAPWEGCVFCFLPPSPWKQKWGEQHSAFSANKRKTLKEVEKTQTI